MPEANPLNSHGRARTLLRIAWPWLGWCVGFSMFLGATHAPFWQFATAATCVLVTLGTIVMLRRL